MQNMMNIEQCDFIICTLCVVMNQYEKNRNETEYYFKWKRIFLDSIKYIATVQWTKTIFRRRETKNSKLNSFANIADMKFYFYCFNVIISHGILYFPIICYWKLCYGRQTNYNWCELLQLSNDSFNKTTKE